MNILIADDEPEIIELVELYMMKDGIKVYKAENGAEGLAAIDQGHTFDLVISDNQMPVMTGMEFIQRLAQRSYLTTHHLILYSGNLTPELEQKARDLGVSEVLSKPYNFSDLLVFVRQACENPKA